MENIIDTPSIQEIATFTEWLRDVLREPDNAAQWADHLVAAHDWSRSNTVEVPSYATHDKNPAIYSFGAIN